MRWVIVRDDIEIVVQGLSRESTEDIAIYLRKVHPDQEFAVDWR